MAFFLRHLTDPTSIAEETSVSKVIQHVRETAVCLAVLGQVDHGTGLLTILHAHGIPPFDLREFGPEVFSEDFDRCRTLGKGCDENGSSSTYEVPVNPPRADPFTRIVFAFGWEHVGRWPRWATPVPKPFSSSSSSTDGQQARSSSDDGRDAALDALEQYARTLVCNRFAPTWREDEKTYELARELALGQDNRANPHGPIPMRLAGFWGLWERMLAPWQMNQVVKATGRVLALDLSVRLFRDAVDAGQWVVVVIEAGYRMVSIDSRKRTSTMSSFQMRPKRMRKGSMTALQAAPTQAKKKRPPSSYGAEQ